MSVSVIGSRGNPPRLSVRSRVSPLVDTRVTTMVLTSLVSCDLSTSNPDVDVATKEKKILLSTTLLMGPVSEEISTKSLLAKSALLLCK